MATMETMSRIISISDLPWERTPAQGKRKLLWEDPATQRRVLMSRIEPSAQRLPHRHVGDELVFVIEGATADESGVVATGNMNYRPNGCVHSVTTQHGATVLAVVWGHTEPV